MSRYNSSLGLNRRHDDRDREEHYFVDRHGPHHQHHHAANNRSNNSSPSPLRDAERHHQHHNNNQQQQQHMTRYESPAHHYHPSFGYDPMDQETVLRLKWTDNSPRMSRLRDHRQKRLVNKLEQFELWDMEQEHKQKQFEQARDQRYKNIVDRLKCQEFCVNMMKKRHESDIETSRELDSYGNDNMYHDESDAKNKYHGTMNQYRKFQYDMDNKLKTLQQDLDYLNPRHKIEQAIIPRLERTRQIYSVEPDIYTHGGKRVNRRPNLNKSAYDTHGVKYFGSPAQPVTTYRKLKPIIQSNNQNEVNEAAMSKLKLSNNEDNSRKVNFNDDVDYKEKSSEASSHHEEENATKE